MFTRHKQTFLDKIIFVDVDDTLANTRQAVSDMYIETTGDKSGDISIKSKGYVDFCPEWDETHMDKIFSNPSMLYERTRPMAGAKEAIAELIKRGYDVRIATIHTAAGVPVKQLWIDEHFPELAKKVYYINNTQENKDIFIGHAIVDDDAKNIDTNLSNKPILLDVYGIYPTRKFHNNYASSWKEVVDKIK